MDKIMLIEDDRTMIGLLTTLLKMEGFQVFSGGEGNFSAALQAIRLEQPDIALVDVHLQNGSGIDLLRAIRQDPQMKTVRIIMSSGMDFRAECLEAGADAFLLKPYMPDDLIKLVKQVSPI
jgi:DNA-binding response OmpR family regulator